MRVFILIFSCLLLVCQQAVADKTFSSEKHDFVLETVTSGLNYPWSMAFLPDGRILVTEKPGNLRIIQNGQLLPEPVSGVPAVRDSGQGGLLDVIPDPDFENNKMIYLSYSSSGSKTGTEVASAKLLENRLEEVTTIFQLLPKTNARHHFGSRLRFADDGTLYITTGDRGDRPRAQNLNDHAGSLIRINKDGSVPKDNPFVGKANVKAEIYTYGNRNMQGIDIHPVTREIWTVEHGPKGGDELNRMQVGVNYGWPVITYGKNYGLGTSIGDGTEKAGMAQPVHYWVPSIATSSLQFYTGDAFPNWKHNAFVSSLRYGEIARLELKDNEVVKEERLIKGEVDRIRQVKQGPEGFLYLITDDRNGKLIRLKPAG